MVDVVHDRQLHPDIDYHLDYQFAAWGGVVEYAARWSELESIDREVMQLEWEGVTESRLHQLHHWAEEGYLTTHQQARYRQLIELVTRTRPVLDRLFTT